MQKVAREFGMSDVGLAKICRKHGVPVPTRGYWRRLEVGLTPSRIPLPTNRGAEEEIRIQSNQNSQPRANSSSEAVPTVQVQPNSVLRHALALRCEKLLKRARKDEHGLTAVTAGFSVLVSEPLVQRALAILDAILLKFDELGHTTEWDKEPSEGLSVTIGGQKVDFQIAEVLDQKSHEPTPKEIRNQKQNPWIKLPKWDYIPSGRLKIWIPHVPYGVHVYHSWSERKPNALENSLGKFIVGITRVAQAIQLHNEEEERKVVAHAPIMVVSAVGGTATARALSRSLQFADSNAILVGQPESDIPTGDLWRVSLVS